MPPSKKVTSHAHDRPVEFDARLLAYRPGMHNLAQKLTARHDPRFRTVEAIEDLVTDTIVYCLDNWRSYRAEGGWWGWIYWAMRGLLKADLDHYNVRRGIEPVDSDFHFETASTPASQHHAAVLAETLAAMPPGRDTDVLLKRAAGYTLDEIGAQYGVGRERARQLEERARAGLNKRAGRNV